MICTAYRAGQRENDSLQAGLITILMICTAFRPGRRKNDPLHAGLTMICTAFCPKRRENYALEADDVDWFVCHVGWQNKRPTGGGYGETPAFAVLRQRHPSPLRLTSSACPPEETLACSQQQLEETTPLPLTVPEGKPNTCKQMSQS